MDWSVNVGNISDLVKVYSRCHLRRLRLGTSSIDDFIREYTESMLSKKITRETKIILIGCGMEFYERRRINLSHISGSYFKCLLWVRFNSIKSILPGRFQNEECFYCQIRGSLLLIQSNLTNNAHYKYATTSMVNLRKLKTSNFLEKNFHGTLTVNS